MKDILRYFLLAFLVFTIVGIVAGWSHRKEVAADKLYPLIETVDRDGRYYLQAQTDDYYYLYSVDDNTIEEFEESMALTAQYEQDVVNNTSKQHNQIVQTIGDMLGPTAGASLTLAQAVNAFKKPKFWSVQSFKKNVTLLIGSLSGYFVGEWIGKNFRTSPGSPLSNRLLSEDMVMWQRAEHLRLKATLMEIQTTKNALLFGRKNVGLTGNDPVMLCNCNFSKLVEQKLQYLLRLGGDLGSGDFSEVYGLYHSYLLATESPSYQYIKKMEPVRAMAKRSATSSSPTAQKLGYSPIKWVVNCSALCNSLK